MHQFRFLTAMRIALRLPRRQELRPAVNLHRGRGRRRGRWRSFVDVDIWNETCYFQMVKCCGRSLLRLTWTQSFSQLIIMRHKRIKKDVSFRLLDWKYQNLGEGSDPLVADSSAQKWKLQTVDMNPFSCGVFVKVSVFASSLAPARSGWGNVAAKEPPESQHGWMSLTWRGRAGRNPWLAAHASHAWEGQRVECVCLQHVLQLLLLLSECMKASPLTSRCSSLSSFIHFNCSRLCLDSTHTHTEHAYGWTHSGRTSRFKLSYHIIVSNKLQPKTNVKY